MISFTNVKPDITAAQIAGAVPVLAELLHSFGAYSLSVAQQGSLTKAIWYAIGLVGADAAIRIGRNLSPAAAAEVHFAHMPPADKPQVALSVPATPVPVLANPELDDPAYIAPTPAA